MKKIGMGSRLLAALLALTMIVSVLPLSVFADDGDITDGKTGLNGDINTLDTISWPIKVYDYLNDGLLFEYANEKNTDLSDLDGDAYGGGEMMPGDFFGEGILLGNDYTVNSSESDIYDWKTYSHWLVSKSGYNEDYAQQGIGIIDEVRFLRLVPSAQNQDVPAMVISDFKSDAANYSGQTGSYPKERVRYAVLIYRTNVSDLQLAMGVSDPNGGSKVLDDELKETTGPDSKKVAFDLSTEVTLTKNTETWSSVVVDMSTGDGASKWNNGQAVTQIVLDTNMSSADEYLDLSYVAYFANEAEALRFAEKATAFSNNPGEYLPDQTYVESDYTVTGPATNPTFTYGQDYTTAAAFNNYSYKTMSSDYGMTTGQGTYTNAYGGERTYMTVSDGSAGRDYSYVETFSADGYTLPGINTVDWCAMVYRTHNMSDTPSKSDRIAFWVNATNSDYGHGAYNNNPDRWSNHWADQSFAVSDGEWTYAVFNLAELDIYDYNDGYDYNDIAQYFYSMGNIRNIGIYFPGFDSGESMDISHLCFFSSENAATNFGKQALAYMEGENYSITVKGSGETKTKHWNMGNNTAFTMLYASSGGGWRNTYTGGSNSWTNGYYSYQIGKHTGTDSWANGINSYRNTAKTLGYPVPEDIYFYSVNSNSSHDMSQYDFGYKLFNTITAENYAQVMTAGLLQNDLISVTGVDGKTYRIPEYKQSAVEYIALLVKQTLSIGQKDYYGNYNYNFVRGSVSAQFADADGNKRDLASALREALGLTLPDNGLGNYILSPAACGGSYAQTKARQEMLIGTYAKVIKAFKDQGLSFTFYDAAFYLMHNLFVDDSYNQLQDDYNYLVLSKATVSATGKEAFVFDAGFTTGNGSADSQSAVQYNEDNGTIYLSTAVGKDQIEYSGGQQTTRYPFLPVQHPEGDYQVNTHYNSNGTPYFEDDGANAVTNYGGTYATRDYSYVMQANAEFVYHYQDDLFFQFQGDDDVYLFVNGELVMDIGAAHSVTSVIFSMNEYVLQAQKELSFLKQNYGYRPDISDDKFEKILDKAVKDKVIKESQKDEYRRWHHLNLIDGESYPIDFYYMERHGWGANMRVATNILMTDPAMVTEKKAYQDRAEINYGGIVAPDKRIEYSFSVTNEGKGKLYNLTFNDYDIGLTLSPKTGLTVTERTDGEKENYVIVTDARGQKLDASDLIVRVEGYKDEKKTQPVSLDVRFDGQDPNGELMRFLKDLTSNDGTESEDTDNAFSGNGLWRHATVTIRGIYCQLSKKQIHDEQFNNAVFTTANPAVDSDLVLNSADTHQVRLIGDARHIYQWASDELAQWIGDELAQEKSNHEVYFTCEDLVRWLGGSVKISNTTFTANQLKMTTCRKDGTTYDFPDITVRNDKSMTVNYLEPGTQLFFIKLFRDTNGDGIPNDLNGNGELDGEDYLIVPLAVYVTDLQDDVVVLDYGLKAELTGKNGITANDYITVPNQNTNYSIMGMTESAPSYLRDTADLTMQNYNRISFAPVRGNSIDCGDGTYEYTVDTSDDKLYFTPDRFMDDEYSIYMAVSVHEAGKSPSEVGIANETANGYSVDITREVQMYQKITVLPATVMYYENDFAGMTYEKVQGSTSSGTGSHVLMQGVDQSVNYGADQVYQTKDNAQYSGNSMTAIKVDKYGKLAQFTFTGTGFEIISQTNAFDSASFVTMVTKNNLYSDDAAVFAEQTKLPADKDLYTVDGRSWSNTGKRMMYLDLGGSAQPCIRYWSDSDNEITAASGVAMTKVSTKNKITRYSAEVPAEAQYVVFQYTDGEANEPVKTEMLNIPADQDLYDFAGAVWSSTGTREIYLDVPNVDPADPDQSKKWDRPYAYYWSDTNDQMTPLPGTAMKSVGDLRYSVVIPSDATAIMFRDLVNNLPVITEFSNDPSAVCPHKKHNTSGHCADCGIYVGHIYYRDVCDNCGQARLDYYLIGYINGADYGCEGDYENMGQYKFDNGKLTATFKTDGYVFVKTTGNASYFMTNGYPGANVSSAYLYNTTTPGLQADKLHVPGGVELTFTLVENSDGTLTLSYTTSNDDVTAPTKKVYFNNTENWETVKIYYWSFANDLMMDWPGVDMDPVASETGIYVKELPADAEYVIFNNGADQQTMDLTVPADNMLYSFSGFNKGWSVYTPGKTTLNFDNSVSKWDKVNIYYWAEQDQQVQNMVEWPGVAMTVNTSNIFTAAIPSDATHVIFNNGEGAQTGDLAILQNGDTYVYGSGWTSEGASDTTRTIYFKNTSGWSDLHVHYWIEDSEGQLVAWPGDPMEIHEDDVFKATIPKDATHVVFNNGTKTHKTLDLKLTAEKSLFIYDQVAAETTPVGRWYPYGEDPTALPSLPDTRTIYLINNTGWTTPYAHYWIENGATTEWPGVKMTHVGGNRYSVTVPVEMEYIVFNDNRSPQTANLPLLEGMDVYDLGSGIWNSTGTETKTVYLENNTGWATPYAYYWTPGADMMKWPGVEMTKVNGKRYSVEIPVAASMIIFNNNQGSKTDDLNLTYGMDLYTLSTNAWGSTIDEKASTSRALYYVNGLEWDEVYAYYWSAVNKEMVAWPGVKMTPGEDGIYTVNIPGNTHFVIFTNGKEGEGKEQTGDLIIPTNGDNSYYNPAPTCGNWEYQAQRELYFDMGSAGWQDAYAYYWSVADHGMTAWPGVKMTHVSGTLYSVTVPATAEMVIFNNGQPDYHNQKTRDLSITGTNDKYSYDTDQWSNTTRTVYFEADVAGEVSLIYYNAENKVQIVKMKRVKDNIYRGAVPMDVKYVTFAVDEIKTGPVVLSDDHDLYTADGWSVFDPSAAYRTVVYFKDTQGWKDVYVHYWGDEVNGTAWPGVHMTFVDEGLYMAKIPAGVVNLLFNDGKAEHDDSKRQTANLVRKAGLNLFTMNATGKEGNWSKYTEDRNDAIHQVPALRADGLPLGTYTVELLGMPTYDTVTWTVKPTYLYIDGVRVYQPLGETNDGYSATENGAVFEEVRNLILKGYAAVAAYDYDAKIYSGNVSWTENRNGLDGEMKDNYVGNQLSGVDDYLLLGPNNETYLNGNAQTQAVIFYVKEADAKKHDLQIAARGIDAGLFLGGNSTGVNATLYHGVCIENPDGSTGYGWRPIDTLLSGTEQYYTVDYRSCPYKIDDSGAKIYQVALFVRSGMVSFTNVKFVGLDVQSSLVGEPTKQELENGLNPKYKENGQLYGSSNGDPFESVNNLVSINAQMEATEWIEEKEQIIQLKSAALSFEDEIFYNIFFTTPGLTEEPVEMGLLMFDDLEEHGTIDDATAVISGVKVMNGRYVARSLGVHAKDLGKTLYFRIYAQLADGRYVYSNTAYYSVRQYAKAILNGDYPVQSKTLIAAMLKYGEAARNYFGGMATVGDLITAEVDALVTDYRADMLQNVVMADAAKKGSFAATPNGFTKRTAAVSFEGAFAINYFFKPGAAVQGNMTMYYWTAVDYANAEVLSVENATGSMAMTSGTQYTAAITGISAKDMDSTFYVAVVYQSDGQTYCSGILAYSLAAYCKAKASAQGPISDLAKATAVYGYYAKQRFG